MSELAAGVRGRATVVVRPANPVVSDGAVLEVVAPPGFAFHCEDLATEVLRYPKIFTSRWNEFRVRFRNQLCSRELDEMFSSWYLH